MKINQILSITLDSEGDKKLQQLVYNLNPQLKLDEENLVVLKTALKEYAYGDILKSLAIDTMMAVPILCTCFIEQLATFRYGRDIGSKEFILFVTDYLPQYDPESLRRDLRNKLVHNYSVGETYVIIKGHKQFHLKKSKGDHKIIINIENLVEDLGNAMQRFLNELEKDQAIRKTALTALTKFPVVHFIPASKE